MSNNTLPEPESTNNDPQIDVKDPQSIMNDPQPLNDATHSDNDVQWLEPGQSIAPQQDPHKQQFTIAAVIFIVVLLISAIFASNSLDLFGNDDDDDQTDDPDSPSGGIIWSEPVWLPRDSSCVDTGNGQEYPEFAIGYEPSIAVDGQGNLYYTAHKDLRWCGPLGGPLGGVTDSAL